MEYLNSVKLRGRVIHASHGEYGDEKSCHFQLLTEMAYKTSRGTLRADAIYHDCRVWQRNDMPDIKTIVKGAWVECEGVHRVLRHIDPVGNKSADDQISVQSFKVLSSQHSDMP